MVFICALCCIMGVVLFGFFGWHLYLVKAGPVTSAAAVCGVLFVCESLGQAPQRTS